jgi:hypothetical protein
MLRSRTVDLRWNTIFNDFRRSGLTQAEFCRQHQISLYSFRYHFYQPCTSKRTSSDDRLLPVPSSPPVTIGLLPVPTITSYPSPSFPILPRRSPPPNLTSN